MFDISNRDLYFRKLFEFFSENVNYFKKGHAKIENFHTKLLEKNNQTNLKLNDKQKEAKIIHLKKFVLELDNKIENVMDKIIRNKDIHFSKRLLQKKSTTWNQEDHRKSD